MQYLVTTDKSKLPATAIAMVDGTVPGYEKRPQDLHYDHHKVGGGYIQLDDLGVAGEIIYQKENYNNEITHIVTTQVDADACVAAAWLQLDYNAISEECVRKLRAIAMDCDHLQVSEEYADLADFAAQAVAAMKAEGFKLAGDLGLPADRKTWTQEQKEIYSSAGFKQGTQWLIDAVLGERKFPGEVGEAKEYWQQVESDSRQLIEENRISKYKDALIFDMRGFGGRYVDPRASIKAAKHIGLAATLQLTARDANGGVSYTIASINKDLLSNYDAFNVLTIAEAYKRNLESDIVKDSLNKPNVSELLGFDPWGGREAVGGSGWRTASFLEPQEVIDELM